MLTNSLFIYRRKYVCVAFPTDSFGKIFECQNSASTGNRIQKRGILVAFSAYSFEKEKGGKKSVNSLFNKFSVSTGNCMSKRSVFEINSKVEIAGKRCARLESQSRQGAGTAEHQHVWGHDQNDVIPTNSHTPLTLAFYLSPALTHSLSHTHSYTHTHTHTLSEARARYNWTSTRLGP